MTMRACAAVVGLGTTAFGALPGYAADDLALWAFNEALDDASLEAGDIDGLITCRLDSYHGFASRTGLRPSFVTSVPAEGRMSGVALQLAAMAIYSGTCRRVALVYGNDGRSRGATYSGAYGGAHDALTIPYGYVSPGSYHALLYQRYRSLYNVSDEQLAVVARTFRTHASLNPSAVMRAPISLDEYLQARWIVEPLRLFDYCLINDGGVALIVSAPGQALDAPHAPAWMLGFAQGSAFAEPDVPPEDFWGGALADVGQRTRRMAGVQNSDIDALMAYDNFSPNVLYALEGLGFCDRGQAAEWIGDGRIALGGQLPVNTSGGHLSESYMQGWALLVEAVRQLRGECGARQIEDAELIQYVCPSPLVSSIIFGTQR